MDTPKDIIDRLGADTIARRLSLATGRVHRARYEPTLPASWYVALCAMAGEDLPKRAFSFKGDV